MEKASTAAGGTRLIVILLLLLYWLMAVTAAGRKSNTFDEIPHLMGGYSYWRTNDFRLHPENGVFPQRLAALPLLLIDVNFPTLQQPAWEHSDVWSVGHQFFYRIGNDPELMIFLGRSVIALLGTALGYLIYIWARELFGVTGGLIALILFVFCPNFLAHGSLVTTDVALTFFLTLSVWLLWKLLHEITPARVIATAASLTALLLSKVSAVVIFPITGLLILIRALGVRPFVLHWNGRKEVLDKKYLVFSLVLIVGAALVVLLIWSNYGFRHSACAGGPGTARWSRGWDEVSKDAGAGGRFLVWANNNRLLPEAYLYGIAYILADQGGRRAFLNGEYSVTGWWYFFPYSFLVKTPIPLLIVLCFGAIAIFLRGRSLLYKMTPLGILLGVYLFFALTSSVNIGHRYLLPIYPALFIIAGASSIWIANENRKIGVILSLVLLWSVIESLRIRPDYLAYFNQFSGGPEKGYMHLVDSSLDWGQDLPELKNWLAKNNAEQQQVFLSYFGTADPSYYRIDAVRLPSYADQRRPEDSRVDWTGGIYCVSATMLASVYTPVIGRWSAPYESTYQELRKKHQLTDVEHEFFQKLRFARLCAFLRHRKPDGYVGYSILIYRLSDADLPAGLLGKPAELDDRLQIRGLRP